MNLSERFLNLLRQQLNSFEADTAVEDLVVYIAQSNKGDSPSLEVVGQWPESKKVFQPLESDIDVREPSPNRRWYPLQEGSILLGVLRVERYSTNETWPEQLDRRLQAFAMSIAHCLSLELEREKLLNSLSQQNEQISLMVHQLRNPLAALRTYAQLLLRKLDPDSNHRLLVENLLNEQEQLTNYVSVLDDLSQLKLPSYERGAAGLLLPPVLLKEKSINLKNLLEPLINRASATANLQDRTWVGPNIWPSWVEEVKEINYGFVAEIVANLLENAFKYSPKSSSIGIHLNNKGICIWDEGNPIDEEKREKIFQKGFRGEINSRSAGSGLGLALGRELAKKINSELNLIKSPQDFDPSLPLVGNAFVLSLPKELMQE